MIFMVKSPLIILVELVSHLIYDQLKSIYFLFSKLGELFVSLTLMGSILGWLGLLTGVAIGAIVVFLAFKFVTSNVKLLIGLFLLYIILLVILVAALTAVPAPTEAVTT